MGLEINTTDALVLVLATWRLSSLLADEDGPFKFLERLRTWMGVRIRDGERIVPDAPRGFFHALRKTIADGMLCRWCSSVWFGMLFTVAYCFWPNVTLVAYPFAFSAASILFDAAITNWYRRRR
jgi:hypothetical protein